MEDLTGVNDTALILAQLLESPIPLAKAELGAAAELGNFVSGVKV